MKRLFDLIITPSEEIYGMSRSGPGYGGVGVLFFAVFSCALAAGLIIGIPGSLITFMLTWSVIIRVAAYALLIFIASALYHYFASMLGGRAKPGSFFRAMLYTSAPFCFLVPAALISRVWGGLVLYLLFFLAALLYAAILQLKTISYFYSLGSSRSVAVFFLPWLTFFGVAVFSALIFSAGLMSAVL